ncbi:tRNA (32-2'-O)-methyltransferase regulator THADA-like [Ptychodera flava]|uniref:tRNA (32-2'-O)-methyltransferase regulator THADA-like n=1 Tax=Ptychodera flava TaxID=63121 RepID=UPI003969BCE5
MEKLLTLAKGDGVTGPTFTPQVHALNVLCALYRDSKLGEDVFPFIADGVKVAILGFDSQKWSVRNSCMMLLNALVTRIFGVKRSKDEHSKKNQMSGREFFSRFPSLHGFLLDHLKIVTKQMNNLQPSQFAILLILSRLYSSTFDGVDSNQSSADFIPYIRECCKSNVWKTRTIAARALASLTPTNKLVSMVTELINSLPTSPSLITISQNTIHGILLQLHHLLQHCHSDHRLPVNVQEELVAMAIPMLKTSLWLGTRCNKCDITRAAYLQVIDSHVLTLTDISQSGKLNEFKDIVRSHLRVEISHDASPVECSPGSVLVEEKMAAISWKINAYENNTDLQWLIDILNSPFYEVRLYSMKELVEVFKSTSPCRDDIKIRKIRDDNTLFAELVKVMLQEINTDCIAKVYQALYHHDLTLMFPWRQADCDPWTCLQVFVFLQKRLCSSLDTARCDLSSSLMQLMSKLVPDIYSQAAQSSCAEEHRRVLQDWMDTILQTTSVEQPMELKLMTAHSIVQVSSYLLHDPEDLLGAVPLSLWKSVITLLQDEEEEIRQAITPAVTSSKSECNPLDMHSCIALNNVFATIIHLHGNKHWDAVCQFLLTTITKEESDEDEVCDEDPQGDRLYDKGEANSFAETTELVQLAAEALKTLLASSSPLQQTQLHMIQDRRRDLLTKLKEFTSRLDLENHCPFRSTSTHRYNCVFLYRMLTCLLALSTVPLSDQNRNILEDVGKTLQILKDTGCGLNVYLNDLVNDFTDKYMISAVT